MIVDGFDGERPDNPRADGLPPDRHLGLHVLGDYDDFNAIQTGLGDKSSGPIRVSVPRAAYHFVRFLVVGGNGNSDMPVTFRYADGTSQREIIRCDDWFHDIHDNRFGSLREGLLPIANEMDRFYNDRFRDENEAAVFEVIVKVDPAKSLKAFVLEADGDEVQYMDTALYPDHSRVRFNLLAATGVTVEP